MTLIFYLLWCCLFCFDCCESKPRHSCTWYKHVLWAAFSAPLESVLFLLLADDYLQAWSLDHTPDIISSSAWQRPSFLYFLFINCIFNIICVWVWVHVCHCAHIEVTGHLVGRSLLLPSTLLRQNFCCLIEYSGLAGFWAIPPTFTSHPALGVGLHISLYVGSWNQTQIV